MVVFNILQYNSTTVYIGSYLDEEERSSASACPRLRRFGAKKDKVLVGSGTDWSCDGNHGKHVIVTRWFGELVA